MQNKHLFIGSSLVNTRTIYLYWLDGVANALRQVTEALNWMKQMGFHPLFAETAKGSLVVLFATDEMPDTLVYLYALII